MSLGTLDLIERGLTILSAVGTGGLALRLIWERLVSIYPLFFVWLLAEVLRASAFLLIRSRSLYAWTFVYTEPVIWVLYFLIVWELYSLVLTRHPGIAVAGKRMMVLTMLVALVLVGLSLRTDLSNPDQPFPTLLLVHVVGRAVVSTLGVFLLLVTAVMLWFPIPLSRNTVYYCGGYAVFFCTKAMALLLRNALGPEIVQYASILNLAVATACILFWMLKLGRGGAEAPRALERRWSGQEADQLMGQLASINDALLRVARKR